MSNYIKQSKSGRIQSLKDTISDFEVKLLRYKKFSKENPGSLFYDGLVKNTTEHIQELKNNLQQLEQELQDEIS